MEKCFKPNDKIVVVNIEYLPWLAMTTCHDAWDWVERKERKHMENVLGLTVASNDRNYKD